MCRPIRLLLLFAVFSLALGESVVLAGKYNPTLSIGDKAPAWKDLPGVDDKKYSFEDFDADVLVVAFTCNSCPYAVDYEDRMIELVEKYSEASKKKTSPQKPDASSGDQTKVLRKVQLVAINVNKVEEDLLPAMKERAKKKKFNFVYLFDESQQSARDFGATFTPEFFVLNKKREVVYMGALDDSPNQKKVKRHHLVEAIESTLNGKKMEIAETVAIGCRVRLERKRRSRRQKAKPASQ